MEKKTILAIVLCVAVWLIYTNLFLEPPPPPPLAPDGGAVAANGGAIAADGGTVAGGPVDAGPAQPKAAGEPPAERPAEQTVALKNEVFEATFTSRGATLQHLHLSQFKERDETKPGQLLGPEDLVSTTDELALPFALRFRNENTSFKLGSYLDWRPIRQSAQEVAFQLESPSDPSLPLITKTYRVKPNSYEIELDVELENRSESSMTEQIILDLFAGYSPPVETGCMSAPAAPRSPMCMKGEEVFPSSTGCGGPPVMNPGEARSEEPDIFWAGINEQYFLLAAVPVGVDQSHCRLEARHDNTMVASLMYPEKDLSPGSSVSHRFKIYAGPKQLAMMEQVVGGPGEGQRNAKLSASVDFGWFSVLCHPMLWLLKNFYAVVGNYGVAIIMLTILIKILLLPLTHKSMKSMGEMAKLKPLMEDIRKKHGDNKEKMNQEMMSLYKTHKINPAGGCFPMLLQMPIWIALYRMLYSSVELYQAPFIPGWLSDLSYRDPYFIMPIVLGATMFLQQKLSPTTADSQQAKMMLYMMPAFFTFIMLYLPSGLVLYIFVNSILSIGHQFVYNKKQNKPAIAAG